MTIASLISPKRPKWSFNDSEINKRKISQIALSELHDSGFKIAVESTRSSTIDQLRGNSQSVSHALQFQNKTDGGKN